MRILIIIVCLTMFPVVCLAKIPSEHLDLCPVFKTAGKDAIPSAATENFYRNVKRFCKNVGRKAMRGYSSVEYGTIEGVMCLDEQALIETDPPTYAYQYPETKRKNPLAPTRYDCYFYIIKSSDKEEPFLVPQERVKFEKSLKSESKASSKKRDEPTIGASGYFILVMTMLVLYFLYRLIKRIFR